MDRKVWGYDFEVFSKIKPKAWWCVTFINREDENEVITIVNDRKKFVDFYNNHTNDIFVGYNSKFYDSVMFKGILNDMDVGWLNDQLIEKGKAEYQIMRNATKFTVNNYDVILKDKSLKQLEGFMGDMIMESDVPFTKDTWLTPEEEEEVIRYNIHDVRETLKVLEYTSGDFEAMLDMIDMFELDMSALNNTKASLSNDILGAVKQHSLDDEFDITIPERLSIQDKYKYIVDWYLDDFNKSYKNPMCTEKPSGGTKQLLTKVSGCDCVFGYGGLHGSKDNQRFRGILLIADVASLYPSLMVNENYYSRNLKDPKKFDNMIKRRLELKAIKDKRQQPLKIVINATYGILKSRHKGCYDPVMSNNVCIAGQLYLTELSGHLETVSEVLQLNTDGIYVRCETMDDVEKAKKLCAEWEKRTNLNLDIEVFEDGELIQKDVNNYLLIDRKTNKFKRKGAYVKKLSPIDNDLPIINKAIVDYFVYDTPVEDTINNANHLIDFQQIIKLSSKYNDVVYGTVEKQKVGKKDRLMLKEGSPLKEKVNRVFASTRETDKGIYKTKIQKGYISYEKVMNTPERCFIDNGDVKEKEVPTYLDRQYYIDMAKDRIEQFTKKEEERVDNTPQLLFECMKNGETFVDFLVNCSESGITNKVLQNYITANCCEYYGKTKKLLSFKEWFDKLYDKKKMTVKSLEKIENEKVKELIIKNSTLSKTGKTYDDFDSYATLREVFDLIEDTHIHPYEIVTTQISLFGKPAYVDDRANEEVWFVLNWRNEIRPNLILYNLFTGKIKYSKISKEAFSTLPLVDGDIIQVHSRKDVYKEKIVGKDELGVNIIEEDLSRVDSIITSYEIIFRKY